MIQHFFLGGLCRWCGVAHGLAVGSVCLLLAARIHPIQEPGGSMRDSLTGLVIAGTAIALVFLVQIRQEDAPLTTKVMLTSAGGVPDITISDHGTAKLISLYGGRFHINPVDFPVIGSVAAENFVIVVTDYTLSDCRDLHRQLVDIQWKFRDKLSILELPGSNDDESRLIHRTLLTLRELNPSEFTSLTESIYASKHLGKLTHQQIVREILKRVSSTDFVEIQYRFGKEIDWRIALGGQLQEANASRSGTTDLPQIIVGPQVLAGAAASNETEFYAELVQRNLGISGEAAASDGSPTRPKLPPLVELEESTIQLGKVAPGAEIPVVIDVTNAGERPLEITWVRFEDDCRLVSIPQTAIYPGQSGKVQLVVSIPHGKLGAFERTLTIFSNANSDGNPVRIVGEFDPSRAQVPSQAQL